MDRFASGMTRGEIVQLFARGAIMTQRFVEEGAVTLLPQARKQCCNRALNVADQPIVSGARLPSFSPRISTCTIFASVG
jgi:hypothetical protein